MKIARALATSAALIASSMLIAACGLVSNNGSTPSGSSSDAPQPTLGKEFPAIKAAALAAHSVRLSGNVVQGGERLRLSLAMVKPANAAGWVAKGGERFTIVVSDGQAYIKINRRFLRLAHVPASVCAKACGKYLAAPAASAKEFTRLRLGRFLNMMFRHGLTAKEKALKLTSSQFHGQPAWTATGQGVTIFISKGSTPYVLSLSMHGQHVTFSDWNKATVKAPPRRKVLTAAQLAAGG